MANNGVKGFLLTIEFYKNAVYRVALKQYRGSSLVVTHCMVNIQVTSDRPVTLGLVPLEISTSISGIHVAKYVVIAYVS